MNRLLTRLQKQELGSALSRANSSPSDFLFSENVENSKAPTFTLTYRATSDKLTVRLDVSAEVYEITASVPGTPQLINYPPEMWHEALGTITDWARGVVLEYEAVDPWEQEAEEMANDDSYFTADELPRVDRAIEESLADLQQKALDSGKHLQQIEGDISEIRHILKKAARNSTKKEWLSIFKSIIVGKLVDWGMKTAIFTDVLHVLITSAHDIAQLAEHAARHLP